MTDLIQVRVVADGRTAIQVSLGGPLELGRQQAGEPEAYAWLPAAGAAPARLIVARQEERDNVSRHHALLEPLPSGRVRLTNRSQAPLSWGIAPGCALGTAASVELTPPFSLSLPGRAIVILAADSPGSAGLHSLDVESIGPGHHLSDLSSRLQSLSAVTTPQLNEMVAWLQTVMGVLQSTVGAADFLAKAARALVQIVGLDLGRVLLRAREEWIEASAEGAPSGDNGSWQPSRHVLQRVCEKKRTFWQLPRPLADSETPSLEPLSMVVAAPVLDLAGNVIGALYGERRKAAVLPLHAGGKLEAMLVDLLACGVAAGLARQAHEKAAVETQVRLEQFFDPTLARRLVREPDLLEGREATVTLLFGDVRRFSRHSEKLGPAQTVRWMNDVMSELSRCVLDEQGVLVDYVGDEVLAMWGAPGDQPDQAERAVRAGLAMLAVVPDLNARWQSVLGAAAEIGLGINTGSAQVGNTGSRYKFKYGPLGNTVNLGSRVQGLTKYMKCPLLVSHSTRAALGASFIARRIVKARVANIEGPVDLYQVEAAGSAQRRHFFAESEAALDELEAGDFALAARRAGTLLIDLPGDGPLLLTLSRASNALMHDGRVFDPIWEPPGK